jgi:hypothetical protein
MPLKIALFFQVLPILVIVSPLIVVASGTLAWRGALSHPWRFFFLGIVLAYGISASALWVGDRISETQKRSISQNTPVWRDEHPEGSVPIALPKPKFRPSDLQPLSPSWFLLWFVTLALVFSSLLLLKHLLRSTQS